jgi:HAD superfamily hydrolase (TIGR01509 family)
MRAVSLKPKCIFLDLDGTIVDSTEAYLEAARASFEAIGQAPPTNQAALEIPRRLEQGYSISDMTNGQTEKFLKTYLKTWYMVTPQKTRLIPNVSAALQALSAKNKLALVTMRHVPRQSIVRELEYFGISRYFSRVVTSLDAFKPKPSPEALLKCAEALGVKISDCIIAGDSVNDVRAGRAAGAGTVAVLSGLFQSEELAREEPDLILNDVTALPNFIA